MFSCYRPQQISYTLLSVVSYYNNAYWLWNVVYLGMVVPRNFTNCTAESGKICPRKTEALLMTIQCAPIHYHWIYPTMSSCFQSMTHLCMIGRWQTVITWQTVACSRRWNCSHVIVTTLLLLLLLLLLAHQFTSCIWSLLTGRCPHVHWLTCCCWRCCMPRLTCQRTWHTDDTQSISLSAHVITQVTLITAVSLVT